MPIVPHPKLPSDPLAPLPPWKGCGPTVCPNRYAVTNPAECKSVGNGVTSAVACIVAAQQTTLQTIYFPLQPGQGWAKYRITRTMALQKRFIMPCGSTFEIDAGVTLIIKVQPRLWCYGRVSQLLERPAVRGGFDVPASFPGAPRKAWRPVAVQGPMFTGPGRVVFQAGCKEIYPAWFGNEGTEGIQAASRAIGDPATIVINKATILNGVRSGSCALHVVATVRTRRSARVPAARYRGVIGCVASDSSPCGFS